MKPDWATGPEWDGWKVLHDGSLWNMAQDTECSVYADGVLEIFNQCSGKYVTFPCKSPEAARKAAEALLEAME